MKTTHSELEQIIQVIDVTPQRRVLYFGKLFGEPFSNPYVQVPSNKMLFQEIQTVIYTAFYSKNKTWLSAMTAQPSNLPTTAEIENFMNELSVENKSVEMFDFGWGIDYIDAQGQIIARKGNSTRPVYQGEFLNDSGFHHAPSVQQQIRLLCRKEHKDAATGFYYVFGTTLAEDNFDQLVRLYFNVQVSGIKILIRSLTENLNKFSIPYNFKCVNHPYFFTRCDAAVLYFDKRYSSIIFSLFRKLYPEIRSHLLPETPLFTKMLAPGIAFAENPRKADESFGTHISKMLAQGIMNAINKNLPKTSWMAEIKANLEKNHQYKDLNKLYINPDSSYPYNFPQFNEQ